MEEICRRYAEGRALSFDEWEAMCAYLQFLCNGQMLPEDEEIIRILAKACE